MLVGFTLSPDQKGIETPNFAPDFVPPKFTLSPDQKGIETPSSIPSCGTATFTLSPDQKGIETLSIRYMVIILCSH